MFKVCNDPSACCAYQPPDRYVEYSKTNVGKFTFTNRIAPAWNALSMITRSAPTLTSSKIYWKETQICK